MEIIHGPLESYELTPGEQEEIDYYEESAEFQQSADDCAPYTEQDAYPLPVIEEILDQLGKAKFFSAFDLSSRFQHIPLSEESKKYTSFSTPEGHFEFNRMPFGLKNAPATF